MNPLLRASAAVIDQLESRVLMSVGPDAFGYVADAYAYQPIDLVPGQNGAQVLPTLSQDDDDSYQAIDLGGNTFNFYGENHGTVYASTNGLLTFGSGSGALPDALPYSMPVDQPAIAPLWDNWNTFNSTARQVVYQLDGNHLTVEWTVVHNFGSEDEVTFQTVLELNTGTRAGDIVFNYVDTNTTPGGATTADPYTNGAYSTVGIKAAGGESATKLVVAYDADASGSGFVAGTTALRFSANQAPSIQLPVGPFVVNEGATTTLNVTAVDPEGDQLYYAWDLDGNGSFETVGQTPTFDASTVNGLSHLFVGVQVTDGRPGHEVSVTNIPLDVLNVAPTALNASVSTDEDVALDIDMSADVSDPEPDAVVTLVQSLPSNGTLAAGANGHLVYTPNPNFYGVDTFTYVANDGEADSTVATVTITISPVNDAPVAVADAARADEDHDVSGNVLANDTDVEDVTPVTAELMSAPSHGSLVLNPDGSFVYTPEANFNGTVSFKYRAVDTAGVASAVTDVTITLNPVNDPPVVLDDSATTGFQTQLVGNVLVNDSDVDGDTLSTTLLAPAAHGTVTVDVDGHFVYTPNAGFSGADSFGYQVDDGHGGLGQGLVSITVQPGAEPPSEGTAKLVDDTTQPGKTALVVTGTAKSELIALFKASGGGVEVYFGCESLGVFQPTGRIVVHALGGNDLVYVAGNVPNPAWLYGDDGSDLLRMGNAGGIAFGGAGNDILFGGNGRDILVGGEGADVLVGESGDDVLISALTVFDDRDANSSHEDAWASLSTEWNSSQSFADRVHNMTDGTGTVAGLNGSYFLNNSTVNDDHATNSMDILTGSGGNDWYIYKFGEDLVLGMTKTEAKYDLGIS